VSLMTTVLGVFLACTAAYAFSRFRFPGRDQGMLAFLVSQMFPGTLMLIPLFIIIVKWLGLGNTFWGLVIASVFYSLPFMVQPLQTAFEAIGDRPLEVAATLRASPLDAFFTVAVPLALPGFLTASILTFAHTVGEFGVVLMIGGNMPGVTRVASVQIYDHVEALEYMQAHHLSAVMLIFSFLVLLILYAWRPNPKKGV
ncbi:MAG TPA: ABC transporter permease subunit, partial [Candidatus Competibacteraceae bacterium]|nr:ABC transporter permease subunit [Candidatus Competibacteraceae bacterium]